MRDKINDQQDLNKEETIRLIIDFWHRNMMHHAMWYGEVMHQYGREKALEVMKTAWKNNYDIQTKRLAKVLDFEMKDDIPAPLLNLSEEKLQQLKEAVAVNWLVTDGVWFQAVEFSKGMSEAKRCNDSCWAQFSPFEAWSIKQYLELPDNPGLEGLKKAMNFRLYSTINKQSFSDETENSFVFKMDECRVQIARKRKGMEDYPCKSGGLIEHTSFAEAIDPQIKTECISCPPDDHPGDWFCVWKFYINKD